MNVCFLLDETAIARCMLVEEKGRDGGEEKGEKRKLACFRRVRDGSARKIFQVAFPFFRFCLLTPACRLRPTPQQRHIEDHIAVGICERERDRSSVHGWLRALVWYLLLMSRQSK
jgi:hypothetical protein